LRVTSWPKGKSGRGQPRGPGFGSGLGADRMRQRRRDGDQRFHGGAAGRPRITAASPPPPPPAATTATDRFQHRGAGRRQPGGGLRQFLSPRTPGRPCPAPMASVPLTRPSPCCSRRDCRDQHDLSADTATNGQGASLTIHHVNLTTGQRPWRSAPPWSAVSEGTSSAAVGHDVNPPHIPRKRRARGEAVCGAFIPMALTQSRTCCRGSRRAADVIARAVWRS